MINSLYKDLKISNPTCYGDQLNNEFIKVISDSPNNRVAKLISKFIHKYMEIVEDRWIFRHFGKGELSKLRTISTAKSSKTINKRIYNYIEDRTKSPYTAILENEKIKMFEDMIVKQIKENEE